MQARRLMLIEDNPELHTLLCEVFTRAGYFVSSATDACEAHAVAGRTWPHVAVLGADHRGSFAVGWQVAGVLHYAQPRLPLVMLTTSRDMLLEVGATRRGQFFAAGLLKPFRIDDLLATVARCAAACAPLVTPDPTAVPASLTV